MDGAAQRGLIAMITRHEPNWFVGLLLLHGCHRRGGETGLPLLSRAFTGLGRAAVLLGAARNNLLAG